MKWHVGLLSPDPLQHPSYQWMRRGNWFSPGFPPEVLRDIVTWLSMPGFSFNYHMRNLRLSAPTLQKRMRLLPPFEEVRNDVAENWLSVTREDAIKLCHMRVGKHRSPVPLICQMRIMDDLKAGMTIVQAARDYHLTPPTVSRLAHKGPRWEFKLPPGFELLLGPQ